MFVLSVIEDLVRVHPSQFIHPREQALEDESSDALALDADPLSLISDCIECDLNRN